jgi:hypothetical protein
VHNEWFRVQYEWGIVGLMLWLSTFLGVIVAAVRNRRERPQEPLTLALLAFLPGLALALTTENMFAGAGAAGIVGFSVIVAVACYGRSTSQATATVGVPGAASCDPFDRQRLQPSAQNS